MYAKKDNASDISWAQESQALLIIKVEVLVKGVTLDIVLKELRRSLLNFLKGLKVLI